MTRYRFDQIAENSTAKKKPEESDRDRYVGLEHLDPGTLEVTRWGAEVTPKGDKLLMKEGDVLFGRRRAYQKKVGIAPFDGIFSAHGMVLRPKTDAIDSSFFPFFISSDAFLDEAIRVSVGSLSPTANWKDLRTLEFNLPSLGKQRELAAILSEAEQLRGHYRNLLTTCDDVVKSQFVEMFCSGQFELDILGNALSGIVSGINVNGQQRPLQPGEIAVLKISAVTKGVFDPSECKVIDDVASVKKRVFPRKGDLLFSRANTREMVGATAIVDADYDQLILPDKLWRLDCGEKLTVPYLKTYLSLDETRRVLSKMASGTSGSMFNISMTKLKSLPIPLPSLELQQEFADFAASVDKSKFAVQKALDELNATTKKILNQELGLEDV